MKIAKKLKKYILLALIISFPTAYIVCNLDNIDGIIEYFKFLIG